MASTLAATLALGVGVVLARAGRERLQARRRDCAHQLGLHEDEPLAEGLRRMALAQIDLAAALLQSADGTLEQEAVHEIRKALKRLRALLRLLREELGESQRRDDMAIRDVGRRLSGARDSEVMLATFDRLLEGAPRKLSRRDGVAELRHALRAEHARMEAATLGDRELRSEVLTELLALRLRVTRWQLRERGSSLVEPGLRHTYLSGRRRYRRAAASARGEVRALHEWRKRVKDLRYQAEMLQRRGHPVAALAPGGRKARRRREQLARERRRMRRVAKRADRLGEMLGEDHDLALLGELIEEAGRRSSERGSSLPRPPRRTRKALARRIAGRRRELRQQALRDGAKLYGRRPGRFVRRLRRAYLARGAS